MKKIIQQLTWGIAMSALHFSAQAQCPVITCTPGITVPADAGMCDAIVTYSAPMAVDPCGGSSGTQTFIYTGSFQSFTVPVGVTSITVDAYGAQGGSNSPSTNVNFGGHVHADLPVTPGAYIDIFVGGQATDLIGGYNGGGNGESAGKGGGGASDIRIGGNGLANRVIVAGGAGGGGFWSSQEVHGGLGGGLTGGPGYRTDPTTPGGDPGTPTSSGNGTCVSFNNPVCTGGFGYGGAPAGCGCEGYGGGGGWYGGAGSGNCRGGGGGSSYTDPSATNVLHNQGVRTGNGEIVITWVGSFVPVVQIAGAPSGSAFPVGTTTNTFVAESGGFSDTCSIEITVIDDQAPSIICNGDIQLCQGDSIVTGLPATSDNCAAQSVSYTCTGATTGSGVNSVDGLVFNIGTTTVWYIVTDGVGNQDSCSFDVLVTPLPATLIDDFDPNSVCSDDPAIPLPVATPPPGTYSGLGVSGLNFDPALSGIGTFTITYTSTDSLGCSNSASTTIQVDDCSGVDEINALSNLSIFPNPSNGLFTLSFGQELGKLDYSILTIDGRMVQNGTTATENEFTIDLRNEPKGTYLLKLNAGSATQTLTLIKE